MNGSTLQEINRIKEVLYLCKEKTSTINDLVKGQIDRDFPLDLWALSDKELDSEMADRLPFLNQDYNPTPGPNAITSHRRILGKPIVLVKRFITRLVRMYTDHIMERIIPFNEQLVAYQLATFIRFRRNEQRLLAIEETLKQVQEDHELLLEKLEKLPYETPQQPIS